MTRLGIYSLLAGLFMGLFSGISMFMGSHNFWVDLTISKLIGEDKAEAIITFINIVFVQNSLDFLIYELPFFLFVLGIGFMFLILSLFVKDH